MASRPAMVECRVFEFRIIEEAQWLLALLQISALFFGMATFDA
jgi:hypothetical protein